MREEEGMITKKDQTTGDWQVTISFVVFMVCATAIALALILS